MEFETHVFISYAHLDNEPLTGADEGWITRFHTSLSKILGTRLGRKVSIWRDSKLQGNDVFSDEILQQFPKTALLISVLSPRYVDSEWCTREAKEFCRIAEGAGTLTIENKTRVFKVIKTPVESEEPLPPVMKSQLGYPFFVLDGGQTPVELDAAFGEEYIPQYNLKVAKLAYEMAQILRKLQTAAPTVAAAPQPLPAAAPAASSKPMVYLAECSYDRRDQREALEADLRLHGYTLFPDRQLPREEQEYRKAVSAMLQQCRLAIHMVGSSYGAVPDGPTEKSVVVLQNELAMESSRQNGLQRLIWLPDKTAAASPQQQQFIDALHGDAAMQFGADLITGDVEAFKGAIHATLKRIENPKPAAAPAQPASAGGGKLIHLICDERDRPATIPLRKFLKGLGHEVKIPLFEGAADMVHKANQDLLTECDAVVLFYGAGDEAWKHAAETDIRKIGARREKPIRTHFTYLAGPPTPDKKELIELGEPNLIPAFDGFAEPALEPFLSALNKGDK